MSRRLCSADWIEPTTPSVSDAERIVTATSDLRLSRESDDPHLREVAVLAARSHVDLLLERKTPVADVAAWLEDQLARRPYLRPALSARLAELQAEVRRAPDPAKN